MIAELHEHFGIETAEDDADMEEIRKPVGVDDLAKAVDVAEGGTQ